MHYPYNIKYKHLFHKHNYNFISWGTQEKNKEIEVIEILKAAKGFK